MSKVLIMVNLKESFSKISLPIRRGIIFGSIYSIFLITVIICVLILQIFIVKFQVPTYLMTGSGYFVLSLLGINYYTNFVSPFSCPECQNSIIYFILSMLISLAIFFFIGFLFERIKTIPSFIKKGTLYGLLIFFTLTIILMHFGNTGAGACTAEYCSGPTLISSFVLLPTALILGNNMKLFGYNMLIRW